MEQCVLILQFPNTLLIAFPLRRGIKKEHFKICDTSETKDIKKDMLKESLREANTITSKINEQKKTKAWGRPGSKSESLSERPVDWTDSFKKVSAVRMRRQSDGVVDLHAVSSSAMSLFLVRIPALLPKSCGLSAAKNTK